MPTQVPSGSALAVKGPHRRRRRAGPKRLSAVRGYSHGGVVSGRGMTVDTSKDPYRRPPARERERLDEELEKTGKERVKT